MIGVLIFALVFAVSWKFFPQEGIPWLFGSSSYIDMENAHGPAGVIRALQYVVTPILLFAFSRYRSEKKSIAGRLLANGHYTFICCTGLLLN